ncbi:hypothetical protein EAI30_15725 [Romboutsia ilealis]|uniref:Uncharacterized protein n=1 Tax=Romboutsia faecis TaxID=2764597 RepID=A0ABR7JU17_9FIRM|nr:hypothetical protein [Romboutsia faecis]MBC5998369.1 hypothetical protein [Romboutsia faecis]MRN26067.1 hypothetical protein [Romboutsia ilealis]
MNIFVFLISYGLMIGAVAFAIPMTRRIGTMVLTGSGILFLIACAMLLLGKIFTMLLPFIIIGCIAYVIYSGKNKIRDKKEVNLAKGMTDEERRKREDFLRNL